MDSHSSQPVDQRSLDELEVADFVPYCHLLKMRLLEGMMTAHVLYPAVDDGLPTYSSFWLQTIVRQQLQFDGMLFSDDLAMAGAASPGSGEQRVRRALSAGCDVTLFCNQADEVDRILEYDGERQLPYSEQLARRWAGIWPQVDINPIEMMASKEWQQACEGLQALME